MDRNRKRKAGGAASPEVENSAGKRQKTTTTVVTVSNEGHASGVWFEDSCRLAAAAAQRSATTRNAWTRAIMKLTRRVQEQETPATTSKIGLQLIDHLKSAKDKT
jgi:hypothetical protein